MKVLTIPIKYTCMVNVKVFADKKKTKKTKNKKNGRTDGRTNGQAKNYMSLIYRCGGIKKKDKLASF